MSAGRVALAVVVVGVVLLVFPEAAHAWSPGTHIFLGESILANLGQLPTAMADLLRAFPYDFLYGNIAPDTSVAKKYAPVDRHCHYWHVGQEIHDQASSDALRAFAHGYLCHLAADAVAHNYFVPRQLMLTSSTVGVGHSYWESRFEDHLGSAYSRLAKEVIQLDHTPADTLLDQILAPTIFSVRTSRRLFRGMVHVTETAGFRRMVRAARARSRWDIHDDDVERHLGWSYDFMTDLLRHHESAPRRLDPSGREALGSAKRLRREALRHGARRDPVRLREAAEEHYGLPARGLTFWPDTQKLLRSSTEVLA